MKPRRWSRADLERVAKSAGVPVAAGVAHLTARGKKLKPPASPIKKQS